MEFNKTIYPLDFSEEQKNDYDLFIRQAKLLFPDAENWTIKMAVEAYVRLGNKERPEVNKEDVENLKSKYDNKTLVFETEQGIELEYKEPPVEFLETIQTK